MKYWKNEAARLYAVNSIPANFLVDKTGKIVARNLRGEDLRNKLAELLP
jgi:thioredoxin-related protein